MFDSSVPYASIYFRHKAWKKVFIMQKSLRYLTCLIATVIQYIENI